MDSLEQERANANEDLKDAQDQLESLRNEIASNGDTSSTLIKQLEQKEEDIDTIKKNVESITAEKDEQLSNLNQKIKLLEKEIELKDNDASVISEQLSQSSSKIEQSKTIEKEKDDTIKSLEESLITMEDKTKLMEEENASALEQKQSEISNLKSSLETSESGLKQTKETLDDTVQELSQLREELSSKDGNSNILSQQLEEKEIKLNDMRKENDVLSKTVQDLEATIIKLDEDVVTSQKSAEAAMGRQQELEDALKRMSSEKEGFESQLQEMGQALDDFVQSTENRKSTNNSESGSIPCK